jgi:hypothetical protein
MRSAPRAKLIYLQAIRVVPFVLGGCVVTFLALRTGKGDDDPRLTLFGHVSQGISDQGIGESGIIRSGR